MSDATSVDPITPKPAQDMAKPPTHGPDPITPTERPSEDALQVLHDAIGEDKNHRDEPIGVIAVEGRIVLEAKKALGIVLARLRNSGEPRYVFWPVCAEHALEDDTSIMCSDDGCSEVARFLSPPEPTEEDK